MGQTLTHGIYLPDEGERDCYDGLAANWQLLDEAVGTIAEHTTALAGKAPAVHTHTKSDVTDLFNSANEWTEINTYTTALRFNAANYSAGTPSSDIFYGNLQWGGIVNNSFVQSFGINNAIRTTGVSDISLRVFSQTSSTLRGVAVETNADASNSSFRPLVNNVTNLGSTRYQWNNIYSKGYYYNGVAWGLDKANEWSALNSYSKGIWLNGAREAYIFPENAASYSGLTFATQTYSQSFKFGDFTTSNDEVSFNYNNAYLSINVGYSSSDSKNKIEITPRNADESSLGTSTYKWKSLNGINPGALSLPDYNSYLDVTSEVPVASLNGNTLINLDDYLSNKTGWLSIVIDNTAGNSIVVTQGKTGGATAFNNSRSFHTGAQSSGYISVFMPLISDMSKNAFIKASSLIQMRFYYCLGNV